MNIPRKVDADTHLRVSEDHVIGCCLIDDGATLSAAYEAGLRPHHLPHRAKLFAQLLQLREEGAPIATDTLLPRLNGEANPAELMALENAVPTTAHAQHHIKELLKAAWRRDEIQVARKRIEELEHGNIEPDPVDRRTALRSLLSRRVSATAKPAEPVTRLYLADKPICTPGNITTLTSKAKTGKTATTGAAVAAIIAASAGTAAVSDTFKFRAANPEGHAVLIFDTEQSPYDAWTCYERALLRAGNPAEPKWLHHYSLVGYSPNQLREALDLAATEATRQHGAIFAMILDGCADFVNSVNDEAECNGFVTWLRERTVNHDCPAICVIHSNEGEKSGDDSRGHLGKQLIRKAESNLLLKKDGDVTTITSDKQRKAPIVMADGVSFQWDNELGRHATCRPAEGLGNKKKGRDYTYQFSDFLTIFPRFDQKPLTRNQLFRFAQDFSPIKETAFRDLLNRSVQTGELERIPDGQAFYYRLPRI